MEIDNDRATELGFALISITASTNHGATRAWKGLDWDLLDEMYERGWIFNPVGKAKSVELTPDGQVVAERLRSLHLSQSTGVEDTVRKLEEGMWQARTRFNPEWLTQHLHPEFVEFGRSGRVYSYDTLFPPIASEFDCQLPLPNFRVAHIDRLVVLATYDSHVSFGDTVEHAHRTSTWIYSGCYWQMRMHQGTAFDPEIKSQRQ